MKIVADSKLFGGVSVEEQNGSVVVSSVEPSSKAQKIGFEKGDVIIQIEDFEIKTLQDLNEALETYKDKKRVYFERGNSTWMVVAD